VVVVTEVVAICMEVEAEAAHMEVEAVVAMAGADMADMAV
jgi:hypothetical protein